MDPSQSSNDGTAVVPTLIGKSAARFSIGGRIRAGVKVLTTSASQEPRAKAIYDAGVTAGKPFDKIEAEIVHAVPELRHPLVPKNVPYFTVRRSDFAMPEVAERILALYGEDRGDGAVRLYRFPVVFPADRWELIMPHALMCYGASELKYWSSYSADGRERYCMTFGPVPSDRGGKRAIRIFGGRRHVPRDLNAGRCEPESCPEYQARQCNLTGRFIFLIPGVPSIHPIELATNSFYAMNAARHSLETVGFLRGGRISGFLDGDTSFWITKRLHEVSMIGEDGTPRRVPQWLIELEAPVDLTRLLRVDGDEARVAKGQHAVALLNGVANSAGETRSVGAPDAMTPGLAEETVGPAEPSGLHCPNGESDDATDGLPTAKRSKDDPLGALYALLAELRIPRDKFERYAKKKYGAGWSRNANGVRRVAGAINGLKANSDGVVAAIEAELDMFASIN